MATYSFQIQRSNYECIVLIIIIHSVTVLTFIRLKVSNSNQFFSISVIVAILHIYIRSSSMTIGFDIPIEGLPSKMLISSAWRWSRIGLPV